MPLYIGDYLGDTRHLNQGQHGAYLLLIMHYWQRGSIPSEPESCYCIACAMDEQSRRNADAVLKQFFVLEGESYRHLRVEEELQKSKTSHEARLRAANSRWNKQSKSTASALDIRKPLTPSDCDSGVDLEPKVLEVARLYPKIADPWHLSREDAGDIVDAIVRHGDKVLDGTKRFRACFDTWPREKVEYAPSVKKFFEGSQYLFDSDKWSVGKKKQVPLASAWDLKEAQKEPRW